MRSSYDKFTIYVFWLHLNTGASRPWSSDGKAQNSGRGYPHHTKPLLCIVQPLISLAISLSSRDDLLSLGMTRCVSLNSDRIPQYGLAGEEHPEGARLHNTSQLQRHLVSRSSLPIVRGLAKPQADVAVPANFCFRTGRFSIVFCWRAGLLRGVAGFPSFLVKCKSE